MGLFERFPYTNFHELNSTWIIEELVKLKTTIEQFVSINALKYADPIQWNIVSQYEKNTIVIDPLTGTAYISVQPVPSGVIITNTDYWTVVFDLGSFVVRAAKNFTDKFEEATTLTATFPSSINDWLIWGDVLYLVISPIVAGDQYVEGSNIQHFTAEDVIGHIQDLNTTDKSNLVAAINEVLQLLTDTCGDLDNLSTTDKSNLVAAINEIYNTVATILASPIVFYFDTVADMIAADLPSGITVLTKGYYAVNDRGGAIYNIKDTAPATPYESLTNGKYAELLLDSYVYDADQLGFIHFDGEGLVDPAKLQINNDKWDRYICDGTTSKHNCIKFGVGVYAFQSEVCLPDALYYETGYDICGIDSRSELYFPNSRGLIAKSMGIYRRCRLTNLKIHANNECVDFYGGTFTDCAYVVRNSLFEDLYLKSDNNDCILSYPYPFTKPDNLTDVMQYNNMFNHVHLGAANGAGINGFNAVITSFIDVDDDMGHCEYLFKNCAGTFKRCNTAFWQPLWFIYWDPVPQFTNIRINIEDCNVEDYIEGLLWIPDSLTASTHFTIKNVTFYARKQVNGVDYVRNHHPLCLGGYVNNIEVKNFVMAVAGSATPISDLYPDTDCFASVYYTGPRLRNCFGDVGYIHERLGNLKVPMNTLTDSYEAAWDSKTYLPTDGTAYIAAGGFMKRVRMGHIVMLVSTFQVTTAIPANTPFFSGIDQIPINVSASCGILASGSTSYRILIDNNGDVLANVSIPTGFYRMYYVYLSKGL